MKKTVKSVSHYLYQKGLLSTQFLEEPGRFFANKTSELRALKGKYAGERCFILGNGPSLNKHDLGLLQEEYTFGVNSIFYMTERNGFVPTFYAVEDGHVIADNIDNINKYETQFKFLPAIERTKFLFNRQAIFLNLNRGFYEAIGPNFESPRFSKRVDKVVYCGQSVTFVNLQLAYYMGFTEVYLIGMDFSYSVPETAVVDGKDILSMEDGSNHFDPRYFGKGQKWHDPKLDNALASYKHCKIIYEKDGRKIINASYGGKLEVFDRCGYESLF